MFEEKRQAVMAIEEAVSPFVDRLARFNPFRRISTTRH
jgi:hypothetical protein